MSIFSQGSINFAKIIVGVVMFFATIGFISIIAFMVK